MAVAFDARSEGLADPGTSLTFSHTCTGANRALYVGVAHEDGSTDVDSVTATYNGVAMDVLFTDTTTNASRHVRVFRLVAPATGANNIVLSWGDLNRSFPSVAASFTGVDQTDPDDAQTATLQGEGTTVSTVISSAVGDMVMDMLVAPSTLTVSVNNGNTEINQVFASQQARGIASSYEAGAASVETGWLAGTTATMVHWAWNINAAAEAGAVAPSVNDAVTLEESVAMKMHLQNTATNDALTVAEAVTMHMPISLRMEKLT